MAHFLTSNEKFHVFSKSPVTDSQALSQAVNKSGHTTTTSDIWAQEIPWFYATDSQANAIKYSKNAKTNDLVDINGSVYIRKDTTKFPYNAAGAFDTMWSAYDLSANPVLKNSAGEEVLRYHEGVAASLLKTDNNANQASNFAARIWVDGHLIEQFVASTDKILDGFPATGYGVSLWNDFTPISEGELDDNFIANSYAGVIQLNKNWGSLNPNFKVNCFEYIGKKLDAEVKRISEAVFGSNNGGSDQPVDLVTQVNLNTAAIATLNGSSSETGSVAKAVSDAEGRVKTTTDALAGRIAQLEGIQHFSVVVVPDGQTIENVTPLVENTIYLVKDAKAAEGTYIEYIAYKPSGSTTVVTEKIGSTAIDLSGYTTDAEHTALAGRVTTVEGQVATITSTDSTKDGSIAKALADAKSYTDTAIETELESGGSIAQAIAEAKAAAIASAEVTINAGTGISIEGEGKGTTFTISVADTVATKASVEEVSAAVTGVSETVASIETSLSTGTIATGISEAKAAADAAQDTADEALGIAETAVQSVKVNNTEVKSGTTVNITALTAVDTSATGANGITIGETNKKVTLSVTPATYTKKNGATPGSWGQTMSNFATAQTVSDAIADAVGAIVIPTLSTSSTGVGLSATGHTVDITTAAYTKATYDETGKVTTQGSWTDAKKNYLVTGDVVRDFVGDETAKTLDAAKAYSDSLHSTNLVYVVLGDNETLPDASADTVGKIYLVKEGNTANGETGIDAISGSYVEYMTRKVSETEYTWEKIGTTAADLSGYAKSVTINGTTYNVIANNVNLGGYFARKVATGQATTLANQGSVYANIAEDGTLTLGVASASPSVMGVSKMFTGDLSTTSSTTDATDTAVSVKSAQSMYSTLASLANGKVASVTAGNGDVLTGLSVSVGGSATAPTISVTNGIINSGSLPSTAKVVANGLVDGTDVIETEKINFGEGIISAPYNFMKTATQLTTWVGDMPNLQSGYDMFASCQNIESFCGDLSAMTNGDNMFLYCSKLTSFCGDLSSLTSGIAMFSHGKLDAESLGCIADTLPTVTGSHSIAIGYGSLATADDAQAAYDTITGKGWSCVMTHNA